MNSDITLDKVESKEIKSNEQLKQHSIDQQLENKPIERALHLISFGEEVQKLSVIQALPELLLADRTGCLQKIVPKMQQALVNGSTEVHVTTSLAIRSILEDKVLPVEMYIRNFLHTISQAMEYRDPAVANCWSETMIETVKVLPVSTIQNEITPIAISRAQMSKPVNMRVSSCKLLGEIAKKYDAQALKKDLMPTILSLCQDTQSDVRAEMAKQLVKVAAQLGPDLNKNLITQPLIELSSDETTFVKENAFITIVESIPHFSSDTLGSTILPLVKQMVVLAFKMDDSLLLTISQIFGKLCINIENFIIPHEKDLYVKWFITMSKTGITYQKSNVKHTEDNMANEEISETHRNTSCRQNCALNFPMMSKFSQDSSRKVPLEYLHATFKALVKDPCYIVRKATASCFHDVCLLYWKNCKLLKDDFIQLCRDDAVDVLDSLIPNLYSIMEMFLRNNVFKMDIQDEVLDVLLHSLVKCELTLCKGYKWRGVVTFLEQTRNFYRFVPSELLYSTLILGSIKITHSSRVVPVRIAALKNLLTFMRFTTRFQHRKELKDKIMSEFCGSNNFYDRILYVKILPIIIELFSTNYFKEYFYLKTIRLFDDQVANIRCSLVPMLPYFKAMIKMPEDSKLQTMLGGILTNLAVDRDEETKRLFLANKDKVQNAEANKLFPDDAKKYEEEKVLFFERKDSGEPKAAGKGRQPLKKRPSSVQQLAPSRGPAVGPSARVPVFGPGGSNIRPVAKTGPPARNKPVPGNRPSEREMTGLEKEFYIDAGIHLPHCVQQPEPIKSATSSNSCNNNNNVTLKKWAKNTPGIPVRRPTNQRRSLQLNDFNKNITITSGIVEKSSSDYIEPVIRTNNQRSHLPRPLSCINFQSGTTNKIESSTSLNLNTSPNKQRHISKLPIVTRSASEANTKKS